MTLALVLSLALLLSLLMSLAWLVQKTTGNSGWVDTIWSLSTGLAALVGIIFAANVSGERKWIAAAIMVIWSLRLATHIGGRSLGAEEDPRYAALKEEWGDSHASRLFWFLQIQAVAAFILAIAPLAAITTKSAFPAFTDWLAIGVAVVAIAGEAIADRQLTRFRKTKTEEKAICETGLWKYSRHPNYFFEWLFWCSWPVLALSGINGFPTHFLIAICAPALMYWLLVHVSGIPPLEDHMLRSRGEKFKNYQQRVNAFFPGPRHSTTKQEIPE